MRQAQRVNLASLEVALLWIFWGAILITPLVHLWRGELRYMLLSGAFLLIAALLQRSGLPTRVELAGLWCLIGDMTLGRLAGLYKSSLWFDKAQHLGTSLLVALVLSHGVELLRRRGQLALPWSLTVLGVTLAGLGLGAFWEVLEFATDSIFQGGAQGSPLMVPLQDTMWDLVMDGIGFLVGALLGARYIIQPTQPPRPKPLSAFGE